VPSGAQTLAERLKREPRPCRVLVEDCGVDAARLVELTLDSISRREGRDLKGEYRRRMIAGFVRATLLGQDAELADFLTDGFADVKFLAKPTRSQMTLSMLQALTELIVGSGIPVAVGFDQLEELLYGQTDDEIRRASDAFFGGLVQLMSQVPGLCVLLFAEEGLWNRIVPPLSPHILDRIQEPIHLAAHGMIRTVRLRTPTRDELAEVVACRVGRTLGDDPRLAELPREFPFQPELLDDLARREGVLRLMLQGCCNKLDEIFSAMGDQDAEQISPTVGRASPAEPSAAPSRPGRSSPGDPADEDRVWADLHERWSQEVRAAERKLKPVGSLAGATAEIQGGLCRWLHACIALGVEQEDWRLADVRDRLQIGDHPAYGTIAVIEWSRADGSRRRCGLGLWLGRGVGKPKDLEAKLGAFDVPDENIDHLILFRPNDDARLSGRSQTAWEKAVADGRSLRIEAVDLDVFARLYAYPHWMQQVQDAYPDGEIPERVYIFLAEQTESIMLRLGLPGDRAATA
jgi:hypothetical protein